MVRIRPGIPFRCNDVRGRLSYVENLTNIDTKGTPAADAPIGGAASAGSSSHARNLGAGDGRRSSDDGACVGFAAASADANIALVKYWGKADERLILPRSSSLSLTLDGLSTRTEVRFLETPGNDAQVKDDDLVMRDTLTIDGKSQSGRALERVSGFLDIVRSMAGLEGTVANVASWNTVPYGAGLASSASAFAALAAAASRAAGLWLSPRELSRLARRGSGSACRSVFGGLVRWNAGVSDETSYAEPIDSSKLNLAIVVVSVSEGVKPLSSREAMERTVATSPLYDAWIRSCAKDMEEAMKAVEYGDLELLGRVTEANSMGMHSTMMTARPPILYWLPQSVAILRAVQGIRADGVGAWSTMDAGPNVKVLVDAGDALSVADELKERVPGCKVSVHMSGHAVRFEECD